MTALPQTLQNWLSNLEARAPGQDEFHHAVTEFAQSLGEQLLDDDVVDKKIFERLTEPDRVINFRVCWSDDNGKVQINRGWRVQHNSVNGPYKGGLRFHPSVNLSVLKFLAFEQTFKNALTGLSLGGGKGGSDFDPSGRSDNEIMRFCQAFMGELYRHIGPETDIPAGDINVGAREIGYLYGAYQRLTNRHDGGVLTGKGLSFGGAPVRTEATGYGVIYFLQEVLNAHLDSLEGKKLAISGAGNVALHAAEKAIASGAKVLTLSDSGGVLHAKSGFSADDIANIKSLKLTQRGALEEFEKDGVSFKANSSVWTVKADIAMPCATQNEIGETDAKRIVKKGYRVLIEGANMPLTEQASAVIQDSNIIYVPGKASNAGGVALSGLEMAQNAVFKQKSFNVLENELQQIMKDIHQRCKDFGAQDDKINYVVGANRSAFDQISKAMLAQGY